MGQKEQKPHFFANFLYFLYYKYLKRHFFTFVVIALSTSAPIAPKNFPHNPHDICELLVPIRSCTPPKDFALYKSQEGAILHTSVA